MPRLVFGYIRRVDAMNRFIGRIVMYGVFAMIGVLFWSSDVQDILCADALDA